MARDPQVERRERQRFDVALHDAPVATDDLLTRLSRRSRGFSATTALQALNGSVRRAKHRRRSRTGAPATDVALGLPATATTKGRSEMSEHRDRAEQSLADAQRNPIQSAEE